MKKYFLIVVLFLITVCTAFSHAMFLELVEPGVFKVEYDGGGFAPGSTVILYSDAGIKKIQEGVVDENGLYKFDPALKVMSAEASDGAGHVAYWDASSAAQEETVSSASANKQAGKPKKLGQTNRPSKLPLILTVLNTCALIYLFFEFRNFKKKIQK